MIIRKMRHSSVGMLRFFFCPLLLLLLLYKCLITCAVYARVFICICLFCNYFLFSSLLAHSKPCTKWQESKKNIKMNKSIWASCCCCGNWRLLQLSHRWPNTPAGPDRKIHILWWSVCVCSWPNAKQQKRMRKQELWDTRSPPLTPIIKCK